MSKLALQLIEKEKQEPTGILDIGNCGLTELPEEVFELTWLKELNVCNAYWDYQFCLLYTSPSPRDATLSRMPSSA